MVLIPNVPRAHASPAAALSIKPAFVPLAAAGSTVNFQVNVTNIPPVAGVDIYVSTGTTFQSILNPMTITLGTAIPAPFETIHCINNSGTGCDANDGPGIVHEGFYSLVGGSAAGNLTLFTISYVAVNGPGTSVRFLGLSGSAESVTTNNGLNSLFNPNGFNITGIPEFSGAYGPGVPAPFSVSAGPVSPASILATNAGTSTVSVSSIGGFAGSVSLTPNPAIGLGCVAPGSVTLAAGSTVNSTLSCVASIGGDYRASVTGAAGTQRVTSNSVTFHVVDFAPSCPPITTFPGASTCTFSAINGFSGNVAWTTGPGFVFPSGCTGSFSGAVLSVNCPASVGPFTVPVNATSGNPPNVLSRSTSVSVSQVDFTIAGPPITTIVTVTGNSTIAVAPINGFSGTVTLAISPGFTFPPGCGGSFTGRVLSVTCPIAVPVFIVPVTGTSASSSSSATTNIQVTIQDFNLSINGLLILSASGVPASSQIMITPLNGFLGTVDYVVTSTQPPGCNASIYPIAAPVGATILLSLICNPLPSSGFIITVRGTAAAALTVSRDVNGADGIHVKISPGHVGILPILSIQPPNRPLATPGSTLTYQVNVTNVPATAGFNIYVITDPAVLKPTSITLGTFVPNPFEEVRCINGVGTGCDPNDGPGIVHEALATLTPQLVRSGNGTLFTITYVAVAGNGTSVAFPEPVTTNNGLDSLFDPNGFNITGVIEASGVYGSASAPDISVSLGPFSPSSILAANSGSANITATSINGFNGTAIFRANPSTGLSCDPVAPVSLTPGSTGTSTLTCRALIGADYTVSVTSTGTATIGVVTSNTVSFHVTDFGLSAIPPGLMVIAGGASSARISVTPINGFVGPVTFAVIGATASCTVTIDSTSGFLTARCPSSQIATDFRVTVVGASAIPGTLPLDRALSLPISVVANHFSISATPSLVYLESGNSGTSTISVVSPGTFTGTVCLTASGADVLSPFVTPACVTISTPQTSASATLSFASIEGQTPSGTYHIIVTGTSGSTSSSTTVTVVVLSNAIKMKVSALNQVSVGSGGVETWTASLRNRSGITQYALVTIMVVSITGTHAFALQSAIVTIPAGKTITVTATHMFRSTDIGLQFQWTAMVLFGTSATNLDQAGVPFRSGSFLVTS